MVLLSVAGFLLLTYPFFRYLPASPTLTNLVIVQFAGAILYGTVFGVIPTLLPELFPTNVVIPVYRSASASPQMIFGGTSPFINSYLVQMTGNPVAPALWVMLVAAISGVAMLMTKDRTNVPFD